jgi:hypothetical protein
MLSIEKLQTALKDLGVEATVEGESCVHVARGRFAPLIQAVASVDEDKAGATLMAGFSENVPDDRRASVLELLNLVHGQNLWNVRFHLDESGKLFSVGKFNLWGKPFNGVQLGDVFYTLVVTTDRLYPCLMSILAEGNSAQIAFDKFFMGQPTAEAQG